MPQIDARTPRLLAVWRSFMSLPLWVQIWVAVILFPANMASLLFLDTWAGVAAAWAFAFVCLTNFPIMFIERGLGRLMAIPHLFAWIPLQVLLVLRLQGDVGGLPVDAREQAFIVALLLINGISLVFDVLDTARWLRGERDIPGHAPGHAGAV